MTILEQLRNNKKDGLWHP